MKLPVLYHGTSLSVLRAIQAGRKFTKPVFAESNVSMGGAYLTSIRHLAEAHALLAGGKHQAEPVILRIDPVFALLPDEDWVVRASETLDEIQIRRAGLTRFMADLFGGYMGDGHSLSDHYKARYKVLNARHGITWERSLKYIQSVRQAERLTKAQILEIIPVKKTVQDASRRG